MKKVKLFNEFAEPTTDESIINSQIEEANADGTISDDEDDRLDDLLGDVEMQIDELIQQAKTQAYEIGGNFRGPGMTSQLKKLMLDKLKRMKN